MSEDTYYVKFEFVDDLPTDCGMGPCSKDEAQDYVARVNDVLDEEGKLQCPHHPEARVKSFSVSLYEE